MTTMADLLSTYTTQSQMSSFFTDNLGIYNVKSYGAVGDDSTNDYTALYNTSAAADDNGGIVFFPTGTYKIGTSITFPSNVTLWFANGAKLSPDSGKTITINGPIEAPLSQIFAGNGTITLSGSLTEVYPQWWGADDTVALQAAVNSITKGKIFLSTFTYLLSNKIIFKPGIAFSGSSRTGAIITQTNDLYPAFEYLSPLSGGDITSGIVFENLTINAKQAIKINQSGDYTTIFSQQQAIKGGVFRNLVLHGTYAASVDANYNSDVVPTIEELKGYGVGLDCAKLFDALVENCQIEGYGVGIYFDGCDINRIDTNRLNFNARHVHLYGHNTFGGQNKILNNDILANCRRGAIANGEGTDNQFFTQIENNYFESYQPSAEYITSKRCIGTLIRGNRFDNTTQAGTPFISLSPAYGFIVTENRWNPSTPVPPVEILNTYWSCNNSRLGVWKDNQQEFPVPSYPCVLTDNYNPLLWTFNNIRSMEGVASTSWPFIVSPVTSRYCLKTTNSSYITYSGYLTPQWKNYLLRLVGRKNSGAGYMVISYIGAVTTALFTGYAGFTLTTEVETILQTVRIPATEVGNGYFKFELVNTEVEWEAIEIVPVDYLLATAAPTTGTFSVGEKVYKITPTAGNYVGWTCITAGTPGTWKGFGMLEA